MDTDIVSDKVEGSGEILATFARMFENVSVTEAAKEKNVVFEAPTTVIEKIATSVTEYMTEPTLNTVAAVLQNGTKKENVVSEGPTTTIFEKFATTVTEYITEPTLNTVAAVLENATKEVLVITTTETVAVPSIFETNVAAMANATIITEIAAITSTIATTENELTVEDLQQSMDTFFILINSMFIFFLQGGFAFLEAGSVRSKNTTNILIKNLLDILLACVAFWTVGYMFAYSEGNSFIGTDVTYICSIELGTTKLSHWFWQFVFCATAATIVSGAVAERCELAAYFTYSIVITGLIYPVVAHWAWTADGWLAVNGYVDFAGSGVVHHLGGVCGFIGALFLGPRIGRFDAQGKPVEIAGHSVPLASLGAFILLLGFFAFNGSTQGAIGTPEDMLIVEKAVMNTMIGGCSSGLAVLIFFKCSQRKWSLLSTINGTLCGMVTTCAFCNLAEPYITFFVGIAAGAVYTLIHFGMIWLKIDDPLDAVAVHSGGGVLGVLVTPLVISEGGVFDAENEVTAMHQIWSQFVGILVITAWAAAVSCLIFYVLKLNNKLRVSEDVEVKGLDITEHGEAAYPADAWREEQYRLDSGVKVLPPNMSPLKEKKEFIQMKDKKQKSQNDNETIVFERKMTGPWNKVNKELKKQMLNLEDDPDSEVFLKVKPLGFRKLRSESRLVSETDTASSSTSSELEKKPEINKSAQKVAVSGGITNDAFEDDEPDYISNHSAKPFKETHFGGSFRNIDEEIEKRKDRVGILPHNEDKTDEDVYIESDEDKKEFNSSTLKLYIEESEKNDESSKGDAIYEQLGEPKFDPLLSVRHIEFNNSRESSMI